MKEYPLSSIEGLIPLSDSPPNNKPVPVSTPAANGRIFKDIENVTLGPVGEPIGTCVLVGVASNN